MSPVSAVPALRLDVKADDSRAHLSGDWTLAALTADPRGITTASGRSKWCGAAVVATLSFDITASSVGIFAPK